MKIKKLRILSVIMAAVLMLTCVTVVSADTAGVSKGAGVIAAVSGTDAEETDPQLTTGDSFSQELTAAEEEALDSIEYDLDEYENNEVLVMYTDGSLEVKQYDSQEALAAGLQELDSDESVDTYQPNFSYENETVTSDSALTDDSYSLYQWALSNDGSFTGYRTSVNAEENVDVSAEKAWEYYQPERDVVVALIDTGVQYDHTELAGSFWTNDDEIAGNGIDDDENGYIDDVNGWNFYNNNNNVYTGSEDAHGTHGAGTISAEKDNGEGTAGLADYNNIKIMMLKSLGGSEGAGTTLSLALAIRYAEANGASICNLSLGTETNDKVLYMTMKNSDMLFVVAAGNGDASGRGTDIDKNPSYPAAYDLDNIITVANVSADGKLSSSSDYGAASVDLAAPGTDIIGTTVNGKYAYMTGTSMAAPFVTAAAALVYSSNSTLTLADTKNILLSTVKTDTALSGKVLTGGILDCGSAVAYAVTGSMQRTEEEGTIDAGSSDSGSDTVSKEPEHSFTGTPFGQEFLSGGYRSISMPSIDFTDFLGFHFQIQIPRLIQIMVSDK